MEKPTFKQQVVSFQKFLWNSEEKKVLGRGGRSWAELGLFYLVYYTCLAGFFAATLAVFYQTIDSDEPKLTGDSSLLKGNPGMGFQPIADIDTTLVRVLDAKDYESSIKAIRKVLKEYKEAEDARVGNSTAGQPDGCTSGNLNTGDNACHVSYNDLTEDCNEGNQFGLVDGKPCILLKLNKIYGWTPKLWEPAEGKTAKKVPKRVQDEYKADRIWVYCRGENQFDEENIGHEEIKYYPQQGFDLMYFPYKKQKDYLSPLVFVKFNNATKYIALMVECIAIAKNIHVDRTDKEGGVNFELLIDAP